MGVLNSFAGGGGEFAHQKIAPGGGGEMVRLGIDGYIKLSYKACSSRLRLNMVH